ncbi:hypothetical protein BGW80DRAFT_544397 [Lactifluus volemus]|nr:hypothetical protein BGW80DRAFT_544397 [Lactifluus volemus]
MLNPPSTNNPHTLILCFDGLEHIEFCYVHLTSQPQLVSNALDSSLLGISSANLCQKTSSPFYLQKMKWTSLTVLGYLDTSNSQHSILIFISVVTWLLWLVMDVGNPGVSPAVPLPLPLKNPYPRHGYGFPAGLSGGIRKTHTRWVRVWVSHRVVWGYQKNPYPVGKGMG